MIKRATATFLAILLGNAVALAQADEGASRQAQAELFERMRSDPANLDLMFAYAAASMQVGDLEAAIATLERMLIFNPDLPRVRLELGVAYFRLGAYDVSRFYFDSALAADPPEEVRARVAPFLAAIDDRTRTSRFSGYLSIGPVYSSNANLGPSDREIRVASFPGGVGVLPSDATSQSDGGIRVGAGVSHSYDLGRPNEDVWLTSLDYAGLRYFSEDSGDFDALSLVTGPRLSVDERQFGIKARPFVEGGFVRSADQPLYRAAGGGVELTGPVTPDVGFFATIGAQHRHYNRVTASAGNFDGVYGRVTAGVAYTGLPDTIFRIGAGFETDRTSEDFTSNNEFGLRASATRLLAGPDGLAGPLRLSGFGQIARRLFDDPDPAVDPGRTRRDWEGRVGAQLFVPVADQIGVALDVSYFERDSNIENFDVDNFEVGVSFIVTF